MQAEQLKASVKEIYDLKAAFDEHAIAATTDPQGKIIYVNDKFCAISKFSRAELLGQDHRIINSGFHPKAFIRDLWATIGQGKIWKGEIKNRAKDGSLYWVDATIVPILNEDGRPLQYVAIQTAITERKQAEAAALQLAAIIESSDDAIISKDLNSSITSWNQGAGKIFGYTAEEMVGTSIMRLIPADRQDEENHILEKIKRGESVAHFETRRLAKDGRLIDVSVTASPIRDVTGKVYGVSKVARNISERKRVENALQESIHFAQSTIDALSAHVCVLEETGLILATNEAWRRFAKANPPPVPARMADNYLTVCDASAASGGGDAAAFAAGIRAVIHAERAEFAMEYACHSPSEKRWFVGRVTRFPGDSPVRVVVAHENITERKQAEESLRQSKEQLRVVTENARVGLVMVNRERRYTFANATYAEILGLPAAENLVGQRVPDVLPRLYEDQIRPRLDRAFAGERIAFELHMPTPAGERFYAVRYEPTMVDGSEHLVVVVIMDTTERKKLEAQFRQAQKMEGVGQLAGGVAHDFNNILAVIQMQSELLKISGGLSADQIESVDEISATVERAAALTRQLLLFSRREVFQPRKLDLSESITNTAKMLRRILGENVRMQLKLAPQPMLIHADAGMMDQILLNLAVNARDAMPNGGQLVIETCGVDSDEDTASPPAEIRPGSFVRLSVSDSGCGIPPEIIPKIFEPFFTTKDVGKGTGLGLATVFGIVQQHQGWINVSSEVNNGTTFQVYLPRLARSEDQQSPQPATTAMRGGTETILLAEDDPSLRTSVRKTLSQLGYRILEAPTAIRALEVWKQNREEIRLLLTDLVMPDRMTGKDLAEQLLLENPGLKVIYMSGYSAEVVGKDFPLNEGVNFLTKPFSALKLAQTIRDSLDKPV